MLHVGVLFNYRTPTTSKNKMREKLKKAIDRHESVCYNKFRVEARQPWGTEVTS